jgi:hypothetical protein
MSINDTDRLDWLEALSDPMLLSDYETGLWGVAEYRGSINDRYIVHLSKEHQTLRHAIDAAMDSRAREVEA